MVFEKTLALALGATLSLGALSACTSVSGQLSPMDRPAWIFDALDEGRVDHVIEELNSLKSLGQVSAWNSFGLGRAYALKGYFNLARDAYDEALVLSPGMPQVAVDLSNLALHEGDSREALAYLAPLGDQNEHVEFDRALIYLLQQKEFECLRSLDRSLELNAAQVDVLELKATILIRLRRYTEAEAVCRDLLKRHPGSAFAVWNLVYLTHHGGRVAERDDLIRQLRRIDGAVPETAHQILKKVGLSFPWPPESSFEFKDWEGKSWTPSVASSLPGDPTAP